MEDGRIEGKKNLLLLLLLPLYYRENRDWTRQVSLVFLLLLLLILGSK